MLLNSSGNVLSWFGIHLDPVYVKSFVRLDQDVAIGELESLASLVSMKLWAHQLASSKLLLYIDNEGARFALIKGYSKSLRVSQIAALVTLQLDNHCILPWFGRVPSSSNIADFPSRLMDHPMLGECTRTGQCSLHAILKECHENVLSFSFDHL